MIWVPFDHKNKIFFCFCGMLLWSAPNNSKILIGLKLVNYINLLFSKKLFYVWAEFQIIYLQDNLQELFWTQVLEPLCPDLIFVTVNIQCAHGHGRGALKSYLNSLLAQNLSSCFSKCIRFLASTTSSGSLFLYHF